MRQRTVFPVVVLGALLLSMVWLGGCAKKTPEPEVTGTQDPTSLGTTPSEPEPTEWERAGITEEEWRLQQAERERATTMQDIRFEFDRWDLSPAARESLGRLGDHLISRPEIRLIVEGHCDERGSESYNLALGEKRASAAKRYLVSYGVDENRLRTVSYGEERPLDPRHTEEAWAQNRRAHFALAD